MESEPLERYAGHLISHFIKYKIKTKEHFHRLAGLEPINYITECITVLHCIPCGVPISIPPSIDLKNLHCNFIKKP